MARAAVGSGVGLVVTAAMAVARAAAVVVGRASGRGTNLYAHCLQILKWRR